MYRRFSVLGAGLLVSLSALLALALVPGPAQASQQRAGWPPIGVSLSAAGPLAVVKPIEPVSGTARVSPLAPPIPISRASPIVIAGRKTPAYYVVNAGDTLFLIAEQLEVDMATLAEANGIANVDVVEAGRVLRVPGRGGTLPPPAVAAPVVGVPATLTLTLRPGPVERMTKAARAVTSTSPFYAKTWVTYYGRPQVPIMGIVGEHDVVTLTTLLEDQALRYDVANGSQLGVQGAFHLVYGMATRAPGDDGSHLAYLPDEQVLAYVEQAEKHKLAVILDVQIGALSPADAIKPALPFLHYDNVQLAIDPEFAISYRGQTWPGNPIGYVTAAQVNEVQRAIQDYLQNERIRGKRILLVHQFQDSMIVDKDKLETVFPQVELTLSVDGWGPPYGKISKYNSLVDAAAPFTAFKLFYRWDEPLMNERQALGIDPFAEYNFIEITPNMIIYQ